jgi:hypothetical protein
MHKQTSFLITAAILIAAVATVALYTVKAAIAQPTMTKGPTNTTAGGAAGNATKAGNMTAGNATKAGNMTAGGGNMTKSK